VSQSHGSSLWQEPAGSGGAPTPLAAYFVKSGSKWIVATTGAIQGRLLDVNAVGKFVLIDVSAEYKLVTVSGAKVGPNMVGTAAAVMVKTGVKYSAAAIAGATQAAQFFADACRGKLRLVPLTTRETLLVLVRSKVLSY
jgi:hypothetical protein